MRSLFTLTKTSLLGSMLILSLIQCKSEPVMEKEIPVTIEEMKTIQFESMDDLEISADLYLNQSKEAPFILLFHQAGFSRGEYREIAPRLVKLGFSCIAIDQRSGQAVNNVSNETRARASEQGLGTEYVHALPDLIATVGFIKAEFQPETLIIWGSSYSASLSFILANIQADDIDGVVAFSPGSYFEMNGKSIVEFASTTSCPVFMTSSRDEGPSRMELFEAIPAKQKAFFVPELAGFHGSKALWAENEGHQAYWSALEAFLKTF